MKNRSLKSYKKLFGAEGERIAKKFLEQNGYVCVCQNFTTRRGEIDLIFTKEKTLVFAEVKTMTEESIQTYGRAANKVTDEKMRRIALTSRLFLERHGDAFIGYTPRFDVIEVTICPKVARIRHTKGAFSAPPVFHKKQIF